MSVKTFGEKWDGKRIDYDGAYGYQCVDIVKQYMQEERGMTAVYFFGSAYNAWVNLTLNGVHSIVYNGDNKPSQGDIIYYGPTASNPYGHVAIVLASTDNGTLIMEQNGRRGSATGLGGDAIRIIFRDYRNVLGWMTNQSPSLTASQTKTIRSLMNARSKARESMPDDVRQQLQKENDRYRDRYGL